MIKGTYKKQHQNTNDNSIAIQVGGDLIISYISDSNFHGNNEKTKIINLIKGENKKEKTNIVQSMLKEDDFLNYIKELKDKKEIEPSPKNKGYFDFEWIFIESRDFFFSEFNEKVRCDDFYISKKPITKGQFQDFINDDSYKNERWWENMQKPRNLDLFDKKFSPSYPKVNLS